MLKYLHTYSSCTLKNKDNNIKRNLLTHIAALTIIRQYVLSDNHVEFNYYSFNANVQIGVLVYVLQ